VTLIAAGDDSGRRLDRVLRKALPALPLSALYRLLRTGSVLVDGKPGAGADRVRTGSVILIPEIPAGREVRETGGMRSVPGKALLPLDILFEGAGLLVVNKPAGLAVHGPDRDNLNVRVQSYLEGKIPFSLSFRPGPLHRLDKPTSGIIAFSTTLEGAKQFSAVLEAGTLVKTYVAVLEGTLKQAAAWEDSLFRDKKLRKSFAKQGEKEAITRIRPAAWSKSRNMTLAVVTPETGRTHQIRSQAAHHGFPLWGDRKYGSRQKRGFFLHALSLEFPENPAGFPRFLTAPVPEPFSAFLGENFDREVFKLFQDEEQAVRRGPI
jgi:23S rRNA pseudouridine955/2504/2580 synthase